MTTRWARVVRGQAVAVLATFAAAFSHGVADGGHPPIAAIALALAFSSIVCVFLAAAHLSRSRLAASVAISQLIYHGLFSLFGTADPPTGVMTSGHHGSVTYTPGTAEPTGLLPSDQWMLVAHFAAALVTFAMLLRGEQSLLAIGALANLVIASLAWWQLPHVPDPVSSRTRFPAVRRTAIPHRSLILTSSLTHRGPPTRLRFA